MNLFWLGKRPLQKERTYLLKLGTAKVEARLEEILRVLDASSLESKLPEQVERHEVAECVLALSKEIAVDVADSLPGTRRFVLVDDYDIAGGGSVLAALEDKQHWLREKLLLRNYKWEKSKIPEESPLREV